MKRSPLCTSLLYVFLASIATQVPFCSAQSLYISQICPVSKHQLISLAPVKSWEEGNDEEIVGYKIYQGDDDRVDGEDVSIFRECVCPRPPSQPGPIVCPSDSRFCAVPTDPSQSVLCYAEDASVMVVRNIWPLMCLWYLCFILFVCCSYKGRQAVLFCLAKCFPNLNRTLVDRMLQRQRHQWTLNFWHAARARHLTTWNSNNNNDNTDDNNAANNNNNNNNNNQMADLRAAIAEQQHQQQQPKILGLKTKAYEPPPPDVEMPGEDDDDDHCCTICFVPLEAGDRVGNLPCTHVFHVDCLKSWVQRKNSCPLCACPLATETNKRPNAIINATATATSSSSSSMNNSDSTGAPSENNNNNNATV